MEFLLNPNIAYLLLVAGILLTILSVITPGTGFVELTALFILILAGWEIYNLPVNYWALALLVLGVIPFMVALRVTRKTIYLAIAIVCMVIGSSFLFEGDKWWQPAVNPVLVIVTALLTGSYLWIGINKVLQADRSRPKHNVNSLIGLVGEAKTDIYDEGSVQVAGELWSATSSHLIPINTRIRVVGREGFILEVDEAPLTKDNQL